MRMMIMGHKAPDQNSITPYPLANFFSPPAQS